MRCQRCGKTMVEAPPTVIYASNPPQWDRIMWCGCGHQENLGRVFGLTAEERMRKEWEEINQPRTYDGG